MVTVSSEGIIDVPGTKLCCVKSALLAVSVVPRRRSRSYLGPGSLVGGGEVGGHLGQGLREGGEAGGGMPRVATAMTS